MLISSRVERRSGMYKLIVEVGSIYNLRKDDIFGQKTMYFYVSNNEKLLRGGNYDYR
ncbi:MAG: hypothetical protein ABRQ25_12505 [Clostridiaceae bacterium]